MTGDTSRASAKADHSGTGHADRQAGPTDEVSRLEGLLTDRAREARRLAAELEQRRQVCRDLFARLESANLGGAEGPALAEHQRSLEAALAMRDAAVARAIEAEAGRAEVVFRLDEAMGHLLHARSNPPPVAAGGDHFAQLTGTARGLRSALAEAQEAHETAAARLMLMEHDLEDARGRAQGLQRQLAETRDQLELEVVRTESSPGRHRTPGQGTLDSLEGERNGLRARADELEIAFATAHERACVAIAELARLRSTLGATRAEVAELQVTCASHAARRSEAEGLLRQARKSLESLAAEIGERDALIVRLETDLSLSHADLESLRRGVETLDAEKEHHRVVGEAAQVAADLARSSADSQRAMASVRADSVHWALNDARESLESLAENVRGVIAGETVDAEEDLGELGEKTLPGLPVHIDATEHPEEQLAARDERIQMLQGQISVLRNDYGSQTERLRADLQDARTRVAELSGRLERERALRMAVEAEAKSLLGEGGGDSSYAAHIRRLIDLLRED